MSEPKASVQRYTLTPPMDHRDSDVIEPNVSGEYVLYSDHAALEAKCAELVAAHLDAIEKAFISGAESVDERVSYDYAFQRWMTSDTRADALSAALARAGKEGA